MDISITSRDNLIVKVFIIGYSLRGESILILFLDKGDNHKVLFAIVMDSFKYKKEHKTLDVMNEYSLDNRKVDMLLWTHPDYDHTYGLKEIINGYCNENTQVILPYSMTGDDWNHIEFNREDKDLIRYIKNLTKRKQVYYDTASVTQAGMTPLRRLCFKDFEGSLEVNIDALSPHSGRINYLMEKELIKKNYLSVSALIKIGNGNTNNLLFFADTENEEIDMLCPKALARPLFLKIPHHTSSTSDHLPEKIKDSNPNGKPLLACTTIYKPHKLPEPDLLKEYTNLFCQVDWTGTSDTKGTNFGYVEYTFDFYDRQCVEIQHHGHAEKIDANCMRKIEKKFTK